MVLNGNCEVLKSLLEVHSCFGAKLLQIRVEFSCFRTAVQQQKCRITLENSMHVLGSVLGIRVKWDSFFAIYMERIKRNGGDHPGPRYSSHSRRKYMLQQKNREVRGGLEEYLAAEDIATGGAASQHLQRQQQQKNGTPCNSEPNEPYNTEPNNTHKSRRLV